MPLQSLWMIFATFTFALMCLCSKVCTTECAPNEILFFRGLIGAILIGALICRKGIRIQTRYPLAHARRCFFGISAFLCEIFALTHLPLGLEQTLSYTTPIMLATVLSAESVMKGKGIDWPLLCAIVIGFCGVLIIIRPDVDGINTIGVVFALLAALGSTLVSLCLRNLAHYGEPEERTVFFFMSAGFLLASVWTACTGNFHWHRPTVMLALVGVGVLGVIAQTAFTLAWARGHGLLNAIFQFFGLVFAVLFGIFFFGETIDAFTYIGIGIVIASGLTAALILRTRE